MTSESISLYSFPRTLRLNTPDSYRNVFAKPSKFYIKGLTVLYRKNDLAHGRLGLAISKKYAKHAVVRNRLRRLIRESFRLHAHLLNGYDIVVLANRKIILTEINSWLEELPLKWQSLSKRQNSSQSL